MRIPPQFLSVSYFRPFRRRLPLLLAGLLAASIAEPAAAEAPPVSIEASSDKAPKARLRVTNVWLAVTADASGSTDGDATPIARYRFDFGDGTPVVETLAPVATAPHEYRKAGSYKIKLIAIDTGGKSSSSTSVKITVKAPPPEKPPTARLKVVKPFGPSLIVNVDASGSTDVDLTPIAGYRFDFGDRTPAVETLAPVAAAQHLYAAAGKYVVTLTATDTEGNVSKPVTGSVTVSAPPDEPPTAKLVVTKESFTSLAVTADAGGSFDNDLTPIATYRFDFGDGTPPVVTTVPEATAQHTYESSGSYTVTLVATDEAGKASKPVSADIVAGEPPPPPVAVYVGYYDTHHPGRLRPKPDPWRGSSTVLFVGKPDGSSGGWDSSCLRLENLTNAPLTGVVVTVDMGSNHFALWGSNTIPTDKNLILAQTKTENFDGSDTNPAGCFGCSPTKCVTMISHDIPVVHVTVGGRTTDFFDTQQILNTKGVDGAGCPPTGTRNDESHAWERVYPAGGERLAASSEDVENIAPEGEHWLAPPYPNPNHGDFGVRFRTATRGFVRLTVYDVAGRVVKTGVDGVLEAGEYRQHLDLSGTTPGIYFCDLRTPEGTLKRSFIVMK